MISKKMNIKECENEYIVPGILVTTERVEQREKYINRCVETSIWYSWRYIILLVSH